MAKPLNVFVPAPPARPPACALVTLVPHPEVSQ
jgi:hypothetical protein